MISSRFFGRGALGVLAMSCLALSVSAQSPIAVAPPLLPPAVTGPRVFFTDQTADTVYVCEDIDMNGDANGPGELRVFYDDSSPGPDLMTSRFVAIGPDGAIYVADSNADFILRIRDLNLDGDGNDAGEANIFYDNTTGGPVLASLNNMAFDGAGYLYVSDNGVSTSDRHVTRLRDENGDGFCDANVANEVLLIYSSNTTTGTFLERPAGLAIDSDGTLIVSEYQTDNIYRLRDTPGSEDGDANDVGEQALFFISDPTGVVFTFAESLAFAQPLTGTSTPVLYVNGGPVNDAIYRLEDVDGNGFMANPSEVSVFWSTAQADGIIPGVANRIALAGDGALFVTDGGQTAAGVGDQIVRLKDQNGDGDAEDSGEATIFVDDTNAAGIDIGQAMGIAIELSTPPAPGGQFVRGDCNADGTNNIADAVFLLSILFPSGTPPTATCDDACDANDDESLNIADAVTTLGSLFGAMPMPLGPPNTCGLDPDGPSGAIDCATFVPCP